MMILTPTSPRTTYLRFISLSVIDNTTLEHILYFMVNYCSCSSSQYGTYTGLKLFYISRAKQFHIAKQHRFIHRTQQVELASIQTLVVLYYSIVSIDLTTQLPLLYNLITYAELVDNWKVHYFYQFFAKITLTTFTEIL